MQINVKRNAVSGNTPVVFQERFLGSIGYLIDNQYVFLSGLFLLNSGLWLSCKKNHYRFSESLARLDFHNPKKDRSIVL